MSEISPPAPSEPAEQLLLYQSVHDRIGYPLMWRVCGLSIFTWFTAAVLGVLSSSKMAALRFRAENSHRFPTTTTGWYYYHKSKNNYVIHAGITQGLKSAFKFPPMITSILFFENAVDQYRGKKDLLSSVIGSLSTACLFSLRSWSSNMKIPCDFQILTSWA